MEQALDVMWQPLPSSVFPSRGQSPRRLAEDGAAGTAGAGAAGASSGGVGGSASSAPAVKSVYRPPGSTGALSAMLAREKAPVGKVKTNADGSVAVALTVPAGARFPGDRAVSLRQKVVPGMAPAQAAAAAAEAEKAAKKKADKERAKLREEEKKREAEAAAAAAAAAAAGPKAPEAMTPIEKEKRVRAIRKKLTLIAELKGKGGELNDDQKTKIAGEEALVAELAALGV